jgi:hypothetical protein
MTMYYYSAKNAESIWIILIILLMGFLIGIEFYTVIMFYFIFFRRAAFSSAACTNRWPTTLWPLSHSVFLPRTTAMCATWSEFCILNKLLQSYIHQNLKCLKSKFASDFNQIQIKIAWNILVNKYCNYVFMHFPSGHHISHRCTVELFPYCRVQTISLITEAKDLTPLIPEATI